jgi:hypothetical protein
MSVGAFVAGRDKSDAKRVAKLLSNGEPTDGAELDGMALIDIATLAELLVPGFDGVELVTTADRVSHGSFIPVPEILVNRLAALDVNETQTVASAWAASEEFRDLMSAEELECFLKHASSTATNALNAGTGLLFVNL